MNDAHVEDIYPLSPMQQGMLFHTVRAPRSGVYVEQLCCDLAGPLDIPSFERAWRRMVERHPILRTSFVWEEIDEPLQIVHRSVDVPLERYDWRALPVDEQRREVAELLRAHRAAGFDPSAPPLLRLALARSDHERHAFLFSHHHLLLDGWSVPLLVAEILACYEAFRQGREPALGPVRPYRDFIGWLQRQDSSQAEAFWRRELQGFVAPTPLVVDRPVPGAAEPQGPQPLETSRLSPEATAALQRLAREHRLTLSTLVQGAFALLLSRYAGEEDVLFGVTVSGRPADLPGAESMLGLFINTLPVRVKVPAGAPAAQWLRDLQARQLELRQHEHTPLVKVREWSQVPRGLPLFESLLVFENYPVDSSLRERQGELRIEVQSSSSRTNYPLLLVASPGEALRLDIAYDERRFEAAAMRRMLGHLRVLLEAIAADPQRRLGELPLLTGEERRQVLSDWNDTAAPEPAERCAHRLFEAQVARRPQATAIAFGEERLSYRELEQRANRIARHLLSLGVGPETVVGICLETSPAMVAAVLGVLKAGGAWLPLDPTLPEARLQYILEDSGSRFVLTQQSLAGRLGREGRTLIRLDGPDAEAVARQDDGAPDRGAGPESLAYVIYTSGSTGRPKGALLHHRGLCNLARAAVAMFGLDPEGRLLQFASFAFDASVADIFAALAAGATIHLAPRDQLASLAELHRLLQGQQITAVALPPSLLALLPSDGLPALGTVVSAGEACPVEVARHWMRGRRFVNAYGPTETTVAATWHQVEALAEGAARVPIGRPIPNARVYVLDRHRQPLPVGVPGELYVGGVGVGRGYLHRPDLTADRFLHDPFDGRPGARMYRTGDRVRWLDDGTLDFLGRLDDQVKIRGLRIELGEIEAALAQHPALAAAAVAAREDTQGERQLLAYLVPGPQGAPPVPELRAFLKRSLPEYMIPAAFVALPSLPLSPSGKVDRRALPAPEGELSPAQAFVPPRTPVEEILAGLFAHVLGLERVGIHDDFFERGGHSLRATQLVSRIRDALQLELPLQALFEAPTVAALATRVEAARAAARPTLPPISPAPRGGQLLPSFAQQRLWLLDQLVPASARYNIPTALRLLGPLDVPALRRSLDEIVRRHEVLRTTLASTAGRPLQVVLPELHLELPLLDLGALPAPEREAMVRQIASQEARAPFDLARGPLLRASLLRLADKEHVALLTLHHVVADGWSVAILVRELTALYAAFRENRPSPLPELPLQYADFAHWQRSWLEGEALQSQLDYWKRALSGAPPLLELPTDRPRPAISTDRGGQWTFTLPGPLSAALARLGRQQGATPFMTLLAAFQLLLGRYSGQDDLCVGTPIANRTRAQLEDLIGFFVNTLVLRADLSADPSFRDYLARVRRTALDAYAHQDLPFEMLVEALEPARALSHSPLFQVMFVLDNAPAAELHLPGLSLSQLPVDSATSTFDLTLSLSTGPDGLAGAFHYNTDLFDEATVARLAAHFQTLLQGIVADPDRRLSALPLLDEGERRRVLVEWNDTAAPLPPEPCFHQRFQAWAERTPEATALTFEDEALSYRELDRRASQLAHHLRRLGVEPETLVAICAERSPDMVAAVLGVLKAGAAYLPLDPAYPKDRLAFMLQDSRAAVLITHARLVERLPMHPRTVRLDADWESIAREPQARLDSGATADSLAYVIYTSGSTGKPKGALLAHRGLCNLCESQRRLFDISPATRILQFSPFSFDASVWEMAMALGNGATLCLARQQTLADGAALLRLLRERDIDVVTLPPSVLSLLAPEELPRLSTVISAGEPCSRALVARWAKDRRFVNAYGPTETTVCASLALCNPDDPRPPSIGRPLPNTRLYVLDRLLQPVPVGVPGELYVGGVGVGRGYLHRPDLTADKFLPDPFDGRPGVRMYRTGDLVRYRTDGNLEFLRRIDHQVKLRGFRIEPAEVEAALRSQPGVQDCLVLLREDRPGDPRLVAYIAHGEAAPPAHADLRATLRRRLPEHMLPSAFVLLDRLPLSPSGKIDRRALPAPHGSREDSGRPFIAPRTPTEQTLALIGQQLLALDRLGVDDDFFLLGGHSLLATQLLSRIRDAFNVEIPLRSLFENPTIAALARAVDDARESGRDLAEKLGRLLERVEKLSADEVRALLEKERSKPNGVPVQLAPNAGSARGGPRDAR